jgi:hypothetical protein
MRNRNSDYWEKFSKTGNIFDYLNYTACTAEDCTQLLSRENKEGGYNNDRDGCAGDGFTSNAYWGL